ncbi:hypothetical protein CLAIMM_07575 isoform 2 [Cladophialophora immunda]|nr:hypothetical protein CLAIMM_07575 isoform 2 [Cladophialophora immunda]
MAISRLQAALTAATSEVTVAAANINFDFTLVKCEAPKEYHKLGNALSQKRKEKAEIGSTHITARRLGALFDGVCDPSPNLLKAYGRRASEIAALTDDQSAKLKSSLLGPHIGIDGTSIWAAATSSPSALPIQLLACMLARLWSASEAVSVWYELVKERRNEIARRFEDGGTERFATLAAASQAEIPRSSLAEWDASARAWLHCADRIKRVDQNQLMLIIANVNIPVNYDMEVYASVKAVWKSAVESMEKLVSGMPQAVNSGPTLLGLSAWHLYPDILTFGKDSTTQVQFRDPK